MFTKVLRVLNRLDDLAEVVVLAFVRLLRSMCQPWFLLFPVFLLIFGASHSHQPSKTNLLLNRVWIDGLPADYKDPFSLYLFTDEKGEGGFYGACLYGVPVKHTVETLMFKGCSGNLVFNWLFDGTENKTTYVVSEEQNGPFDLKLVLNADPRHENKTYTYYSRTDWERDGLKTLSPEAENYIKSLANQHLK